MHWLVAWLHPICSCFREQETLLLYCSLMPAVKWSKKTCSPLNDRYLFLLGNECLTVCACTIDTRSTIYACTLFPQDLDSPPATSLCYTRLNCLSAQPLHCCFTIQQLWPNFGKSIILAHLTHKIFISQKQPLNLKFYAMEGWIHSKYIKL